MIYFEIPFKPIPLQRARSGNHRFYDPQFIVKKNLVEYVKGLNVIDKPIETAIELHVDYYFEMPKSYSKKKRKLLFGKDHDIKPDNTNLVKFIEDAFNDIIWKDDSKISRHKITKTWSDENKTCVTIYVL